MPSFSGKFERTFAKCAHVFCERAMALQNFAQAESVHLADFHLPVTPVVVCTCYSWLAGRSFVFFLLRIPQRALTSSPP